MTCKNCGDECKGKYCKPCQATKSNIRYHKRRVKELEETLARAARNGAKNNEDQSDIAAAEKAIKRGKFIPLETLGKEI